MSPAVDAGAGICGWARISKGEQDVEQERRRKSEAPVGWRRRKKMQTGEAPVGWRRRTGEAVDKRSAARLKKEEKKKTRRRGRQEKR
jgi:hypothetical protein